MCCIVVLVVVVLCLLVTHHFVSFTHADTGGNSFHNSSVLPIYICREHFFVLRHAHALHLFDFAYF